MVTAPLWLALALAGPANAPVTVEVVAVGHVDTPATKFVLAIELSATGDSDDKAKAALGAGYDLRTFDDAVVKGGGVPMTLLETVIDGYINESRV